LNRQLGVHSELIPGSGGEFEVEYGGKLVFSKRDLGRFPNEGEVTRLIQETE
jgi:selenoprotein W-related protein